MFFHGRTRSCCAYGEFAGLFPLGFRGVRARIRLELWFIVVVVVVVVCCCYCCCGGVSFGGVAERRKRGVSCGLGVALVETATAMV